MSSKELYLLEISRGARNHLPMVKEIWSRAFDEYNADKNEKLKMHCTSCFFRVYAYLKTKYDNNPKTI